RHDQARRLCRASPSGPRQLLRTTSWPLASASRANASATAPAPIVPNFMLPASAASVEEAASLEYVLLAVPWRNVESASRRLPLCALSNDGPLRAIPPSR